MLEQQSTAIANILLPPSPEGAVEPSRCQIDSSRLLVVLHDRYNGGVWWGPKHSHKAAAECGFPEKKKSMLRHVASLLALSLR